MANVPEEKLRAIKEKIFELEPYIMAAIEGEILPDHEIAIEWFDGEDQSVLLNLGTGQVLVGQVSREWVTIFEVEDEDDE